MQLVSPAVAKYLHTLRKVKYYTMYKPLIIYMHLKPTYELHLLILSEVKKSGLSYFISCREKKFTLK